jgi:hypothetical protein
MPDLIRMKRGLKADLPVLSEGEFGYCTDTQELFIGGISANVHVGDSKAFGIIDANKDYGALGDGATDETATFTNIESSLGKIVYLEAGTYVVNGITLNKRYIGLGKIKLNGKLEAPSYTYISTVPATGSNAGDYFGGDQSNIKAEYFEIAGSCKASTITSNYFNWELQSHFTNLWIDLGSGYSGFTTETTGSNVSGQAVVNVRNSTMLAVGMPVLIGTDSYTILTINSATQVTMTSNLVNTYPAGTWLSKGNRTNFSDYMSQVFHEAGGDAYSFNSRLVVGKSPDADQTHFSYNATGGLLGGDNTATTDGVYIQGTEISLIGSNYQGDHDVAAIGDVRSFQRNNDTGNLGAVWVGRLDKSEGTKYCESVHTVAGKWLGGFDTIWADFGVNQAAIKLAPNHRIYFDGSGAADEAGYELWGANAGDSYIHYNAALSQMESIVDGVTAFSWTGTDLNMVGSVNITQQNLLNLDSGLTETGFTYTGTQIQARFNNTTKLSIMSDGTVNTTNNLTVPRGKQVNLDAGGTGTYLTYDGTNIFLYKNGVQVATW